MGRDHKLSIGITWYHEDLCNRLEIYLQVIGTNFSVWSIHVLVCLFFHLIIIFITFAFKKYELLHEALCQIIIVMWASFPIDLQFFRRSEVLPCP